MKETVIYANAQLRKFHVVKMTEFNDVTYIILQM